METKPMSSSSDLSSQSHDKPLKTRYIVNEDHSRDKDRFAAKEREEAIKRAKVMRLADIKARQQVMQHIEEDRKAKEAKLKSPTQPSSVARTLQDASSQSADSHMTRSHDTCRLQIRLPDGRVLRQSFPTSASLSQIVELVMESCSDCGSVQLIQPYPHREFTLSEYQCSLQSLNLCPSASLVVAKQPASLKVDSEQSATDSNELIDQSDDSSSAQAVANPPKQRRVMFNTTQSSKGKGHRLGDGSANTNEPMDMDVGGDKDEDDEEDMDQDDDDDDDAKDNNMNVNMFPLRGFGQPRPGKPHPLARGANRVVPGRFMPAGMGFGGMGFGGMGGGGEGGNRLGGKEAVVDSGVQQQAIRMREAARSAAIRRSEAPAPHTWHTPHTLTHHGPPSLEELSTRALLTLSSSYGMPSCSRLSPLVARRFMRALKDKKRLNVKTLAAFHGCPVQVIELDNYIYTTNELLQALCYFPSITSLSLGSCSIITDRAITSLLPYLHALTSLNLNGCRQLDEVICRGIRSCTLLEVLKLSEVKVTDRGFSLLLATPLTHLQVLDLSKTQITTKSLRLLPAGSPNLESLNIEGTTIDNFSLLSQLPRLHTLNIANTPAHSDVGTLIGCRGLHSLSLVGLCVETTALEQLMSALQLESLVLPDRNYFSDDGLKVVSGFPLAHLNLMDYCHVTDLGISHVSHMTSLQVLTLSRTKLTDEGMPCLMALTGLHELSLDNTLVTDAGVMCLSSLTRLDVLSLSDTKVTSQFILDGCLDALGMLSKLNLSRTTVCDSGMTRLQLPSLTMLNVNWTCVTEKTSLDTLRRGCPLLEVLGNSNIGQPLPGQLPIDGEDNQ
ncbi:uncharacterized protein LOC135347837 isoform X2 [Halichondria panicea]